MYNSEMVCRTCRFLTFIDRYVCGIGCVAGEVNPGSDWCQGWQDVRNGPWQDGYGRMRKNPLHEAIDTASTASQTQEVSG